MLQPMLQQLAQSNPQFAQALAADPEALLQLLGGGDDGEDGEAIPPGAHIVNVTPEERAAIERVCHISNTSSVLSSDTSHVAGGTRLSATGRH